MRLPLASDVSVPRSEASTRITRSPKRNIDVQVAQVVAKRLGDLVVAEVEQVGPRIDDRHLGAERREHRRELDADHARSDDHDRVRQLPQAQHDVVAVEHRRAVEGDLGRMGRLRARREHDVLRGEPPLGAVRAPRRRRVCGSTSRRRALDHRHVVPQQLVADDVALALDHLAHAQRDVVDRDLVLQAVALAVDRALVEPGQVEDRLANRLRRDRAGVHAGAADRGVPLDQRDLATELRRLDGRLLTRRPRTDDDDLELRAHEASFAVRERSGNAVTVCSRLRVRTASRAPAR